MKKQTQQKGFTLIEMIVSIAIFVVVALVAIGAVLKVIDANKKSQGMKTVITNLNYALDTMGRELRVGTNFYCYTASAREVESGSISRIDRTLPAANNCTLSDHWIISFYSSDAIPGASGCQLIHSFYFDKTSSALWKGEQESCGGEITFYPMIYNSTESSNMSKLSDLAIKFTVGKVRLLSAPGQQSYIQFRLGGYSGAKTSLRSYFDIQSSISQRLPDPYALNP